uniref:Glucuronosyltransferase n=1 Tax=Panagrellus redivivus TaxID=6233 RepID=A0A7E4V3N2_PANRE
MADRIAMFIYPNGGLVATRDKLTVVRGRTGLEIMKNMYQAAPDVKVVYFFTTASDSTHYKPTMEELKKVGYGNIKMVNAASWMSTEYFYRSSIEVSIGESFAYVPICAGEYKPSDSA